MKIFEKIEKIYHIWLYHHRTNMHRSWTTAFYFCDFSNGTPCIHECGRNECKYIFRLPYYFEKFNWYQSMFEKLNLSIEFKLQENLMIHLNCTICTIKSTTMCNYNLHWYIQYLKSKKSLSKLSTLTNFEMIIEFCIYKLSKMFSGLSRFVTLYFLH